MGLRKSGGYNKKFLGNIPSHTWVGLSVIHKGQRWKNPNCKRVS